MSMKTRSAALHPGKKRRDSRGGARSCPSGRKRKKSIQEAHRVSRVPEPFSSALSKTSFATATSNTDMPMLEQTTI